MGRTSGGRVQTIELLALELSQVLHRQWPTTAVYYMSSLRFCRASLCGCCGFSHDGLREVGEGFGCIVDVGLFG